MQRAWSGILVVSVVLGAPRATAQAPTRGLTYSVGGGVTLATQSSQGGGAYFRLGSGRWPVVLDLSYSRVPGAPPVVFAPAPCPPGAVCAASFTPYNGTVSAWTLAPSLQLTEGRHTALLYRLGPALSFLSDRAPGAPAFVGGFKAGISLRLGVGTGGLLLSGDYVRLLRSGSDQQWFLPITLGWQF